MREREEEGDMDKLCDFCLSIIMYNLIQDDLLILQALRKEKTHNQLLAIDKTKILPLVRGLTDFKFQMAMSRLELCELVGRNSKKRPNKFFITQNGLKILELFSQTLKE